MGKDARNHLLLYLILGYALLIIYASLHPLSGWHDRGGSPLSFLGAGWPRYYTAFDLASNVFAYLPLGFLCAAAIGTGRGGLLACLLATAMGAGLSFALELVQNYLPNRVPSNLDLACNGFGAFAGAIAGLRWGRLVFSERHHAMWSSHVATHSAGADLGVLLIGAWLMTQLSPEILPFGTGDMRQLFDLSPVQPFAPKRFGNIEGTIAASGLLAAGLIAQLLLLRRERVLTLLLLFSALCIKALSHALIAGPGAALAWLTPGASTGIAIGTAAWLGASYLPGSLRRAVAALALLFGTVMVNAAPENPYLHNSAQFWQYSQFLNFNGLTRLICTLWPFLALPWLMTYRPETTHARNY